MDRIDKQLRAIPRGDRARIEQAIAALVARDFTGLDRRKLKGYECIYRVRTGRYRIIYFDDGEEIILKAIKRRDESTYRNF